MASLTTSTANPSILLYSGAPSDCSSRLRIALKLKNIPYDLKTLTGEFTPQTPSSLNPARTVPTLVFQDPPDRLGKLDDKGRLTLTQSVAALEYLEEAYPETQHLLPADARGRAEVRTLVNIIATDIHPLTTRRVSAAISEMFPLVSEASSGASSEGSRSRKWDHHWISRGISI